MKNTFREYGPGPRVNFLLDHGASIADVPCGLPQLTEDTFREYGPGPRVNFLLEHGASIADVPCGLPQLTEDTSHEDDGDFLMVQKTPFE